jgi:hypothetical protein
MKNDPFDFTYHLGDNELSVEAQITPGIPAEGPSHASGGQPAEPTTAEILSVYLIEFDELKQNTTKPRKMIPFDTGSIFIRPWAKSKMKFLTDDLEEKAIEEWRDSQ